MRRDPVVDIADVLDALGVPYVFTGSIAYSAWVTPTATKDVDVVVHVSGRLQLVGVLQELRARGLDVDPVAKLKEYDRRGSAIGIEMPVEDVGTFLVELIVPTLGPIDRRILERSVVVEYRGRAAGIRIVTPEDLVLYKLIFFRERDKLHINDVLDAHPGLDVGYIRSVLSMLYPDESARVGWFHETLMLHGFLTNRPRRRKKNPPKGKKK